MIRVTSSMNKRGTGNSDMDKKHRGKEERLTAGRGRRRAAAGHAQEETAGGGSEGHGTVLGLPAATEVTGGGGR